jgi:hypothetical protein
MSENKLITSTASRGIPTPLTKMFKLILWWIRIENEYLIIYCTFTKLNNFKN